MRTAKNREPPSARMSSRLRRLVPARRSHVAAALKVPSHLVNIVPVDAGGSFGSKLFLHKVSVLAALAARIAGRPVKYIEDRQKAA